MSTIKAELSRQMMIKAAIIVTTNTQGWFYIKELADNRVKKAIQDALDEEDPAKGEAKRLKAKAMQQGFEDLWAYLESIKSYDPQVSDDAGFGELEIEETEHAN